MRTKRLYNPHKLKHRGSNNANCIKMVGIYLCGLLKGMLFGMIVGKKLKK